MSSVKKKWSRREFLETSLKGSIVVGGNAARIAHARRAPAPQKADAPASGFDQNARELLQAAMDEIIPAGDGMPAASQVGGLEYLDRLAGESPELKKELEKSLAALKALSRKQLGKDFVSLSRLDRVEALKKLEKQPPTVMFANLRNYVYEAYYTQPKVWKLIGYELFPTNQAGPRMKPFDESVLAQVRKKPKIYREAE